MSIPVERHADRRCRESPARTPARAGDSPRATRLRRVACLRRDHRGRRAAGDLRRRPCAPLRPERGPASPMPTSARAGHLLGFDGQGRDLFSSRLMVGARTTLLGAAAGRRSLAVAIGVEPGGHHRLARRLASTPRSRSRPRRHVRVPRHPACRAGRGRVRPGLPPPALALAIAYSPYVARVLRGAALRASARWPTSRRCEVQGLSALAICAAPPAAQHLVADRRAGHDPLRLRRGRPGRALVPRARASRRPRPTGASWSRGQPRLLQGYPPEALSAGLCIVLVVVGGQLARRAARTSVDGGVGDDRT